MQQERQVSAAERGSQIGAALGASLGARTGSALQSAADAARTVAVLSSRGAAATRSSTTRLVRTGSLAEARAAVEGWSEVLEGVVEDVRERSGEVREALSGRRPPRRWPWALGAAAAGAAAGAGVALLVRGVMGQDAPGAKEPELLQAVVDPRPEPV